MGDVLCLEPIGGIAGDMFLALALDLGVDREKLEAGLRALPLGGWSLSVSRVQRHALSATHVDVVVDEQVAHPHRAWADIRAMLQSAQLPPPVKERALAVFSRLAAAEAVVHGVPEDQIHFHEVGAVDSIVDIVGAALAVELLGSPALISAPPPMGSGAIRRAHGMMPVPPPAVVEILKGRPVRFEGVGELTTPTGAAIVAALTSDEPFPEMILERVGYGAGTADPADRPNLLRGLLGRRAAAADEGTTWQLEVNLDDATPQVLGHALEAALAAGALDAWIAPVIMKKGRPGHLVGLLVPGAKRAALTELLLRETPTLGVRAFRVERAALERRFEKVETVFGTVTMKVGLLSGEVVNAAPEYEDCARLAREKGVPVREVIAAAAAAWRTK